MDRPQMIGIALGVASTILGAVGLANSRPLPPSAHFGPLARIDANDDGRISAAEWRAAGRNPAAFAVLDRNRDWRLSPSEALPHRGRR